MSRLKEIKDRCEKAAPAPWFLYPAHRNANGQQLHFSKHVLTSKGFGTEAYFDHLTPWHQNELEFVSHARADVPWLISQLEEASRLISLLADGEFASQIGVVSAKVKAREFLEQMK